MTPQKVNAYSQQKLSASNIEVYTKARDAKNNVPLSHKTEDEIYAKLKKTFEKYGIEYSMETLLNLIGDSVTKEQLLDCEDSVIDKYVVIIEQAFENANKDSKKVRVFNNIANSTGWKDFKQFNSEVQNIKNLDAISAILKQCTKNNTTVDFNKLSRDEKKQYIKEYFEENYKQYLDKVNNNPQIAKKMLLGVILAKTSDKEKHLLLPIINEVIQDSKVLKTFFNSFENAEIAKECANTLTYDEWKNLPNEEMKVAYIQNMTKEGIDGVKEGYKQDVVDFYNKYGNELIELEAKAKHSKLEPEEQAIIDRRNALTNSGAVMVAATLGNNNISDDEKKECASEVTQIAQQYGFEDEYLINLANIINDSKFDLHISKDEIKEILDNLTDNKFSEKYDSISTKTATDEKTGGFKTNAQAGMKAAEKKEELTLIVNNTQEDETKFKIEKIEPAVSETIYIPSEKETISEKYGSKFAVYLFAGKVKTFSNVEEAVAINNYKQMDSAQQGKILQSSIGKFLDKLIDNTKTYTLEHLLASGWKGQTFNDTQQVEETLEERKEKLNTNSLPS